MGPLAAEIAMLPKPKMNDVTKIWPKLVSMKRIKNKSNVATDQMTVIANRFVRIRGCDSQNVSGLPVFDPLDSLRSKIVLSNTNSVELTKAIHSKLFCAYSSYYSSMRRRGDSGMK